MIPILLEYPTSKKISGGMVFREILRGFKLKGNQPFFTSDRNNSIYSPPNLIVRIIGWRSPLQNLDIGTSGQDLIQPVIFNHLTPFHPALSPGIVRLPIFACNAAEYHCPDRQR